MWRSSTKKASGCIRTDNNSGAVHITGSITASGAVGLVIEGKTHEFVMSMLNGGLDDKLELHILEHKLRVTHIRRDAIGSYTHALIKIALLPHSW